MVKNLIALFDFFSFLIIATKGSKESIWQEREPVLQYQTTELSKATKGALRDKRKDYIQQTNKPHETSSKAAEKGDREQTPEKERTETKADDQPDTPRNRSAATNVPALPQSAQNNYFVLHNMWKKKLVWLIYSKEIEL